MDTLKTGAMVVSWYATSVWCGYTSKLLLQEFKSIGGVRNAELLSLFQFLGASCFACLFARWSDGEVQKVPNEMASWKLWRVAAAFSFGFTFVNSTFFGDVDCDGRDSPGARASVHRVAWCPLVGPECVEPPHADAGAHRIGCRAGIGFEP